MSRYINYDELNYRGDKLIGQTNLFMNGVQFMIDRINEAPSIDIVRCGECRLNETDDCPMVYYTPLEDGGFETRWWNRPDDFCSWGERKDDE